MKARAKTRRRPASEPTHDPFLNKGTQQSFFTTAPAQPFFKKTIVQRMAAPEAEHQTQTVQPKGVVIKADKALEREADVNAAQALRGRKVLVGSRGLASPVIQPKWDVGKVDALLSGHQEGKDAIKNLNADTYTVVKFAKLVFQRQYYKDAAKKQKDGPPDSVTRNGWHRRSKKEIAVSDARSDKKAASTLVHEVEHAKQHQANEAAQAAKKTLPFPNKKSKEYDAHINQEKFNIKAGIPPKHPSFRKANGTIDIAAIKTYVDNLYAVGGAARPYDDIPPNPSSTATIIARYKPWPKKI